MLNHRLAGTQLLLRWQRQVSAIGGPSLESLSSEPEPSLEQLKTEMHDCLGWYKEIWSPLLSKFIHIGLQWEALQESRISAIKKHAKLLNIKSLIENDLQRIVQSYINHCDHRLTGNKLGELLNAILDQQKDASALTKQLTEAIKELDIEKYTKIHEKICSLWAKNEAIQRRDAFLVKIREGAPSWADDIHRRSDIHGKNQPPGDMQKVWLLKQLEIELTRRSKLQPEELQTQLKRIRKEFQDITIRLVEKKSWLSLLNKTSLQQQSALNGWKLLMRRIGKGNSIRDPQLRSEARKLMLMCQTAIPVWIMPISHVAENFDPAFNKFDVVIIDEASQADVMALTALYLGKQVVVVGDHKQVSPEAIGQKQEEVQKIIDIHLNGIPHAVLYDGQTSIYDLAQTAFSGMTMLREHFRCVESIIQFSNSLSYNGEILPLRDSSNVKTRPFTVEYRVEGELSGTKTNLIEARTIASLILAAIEYPEYQDKTFGIISLVGEEQAVLIDQYLHKYIPAIEYRRRRIRCGNSAQFQGDERDVMMLSMVHAPNPEGPLSRLADPGGRMTKRYNVAASRARDQIWLVHSLNASMDLKDGDLRKRLIDHMKDPMATSEVLKQMEPKIESDFEKKVIIRLLNAGYKVVPQWKVGAYRIDMVVEGGGKRLAIECDGEGTHPLEKIGEDMARQAILERVGWTFIRIRGGEFYRNPEKAMEKVFLKLEVMDIPPQVNKFMVDDETSKVDQLKLNVIQRAAEIRQEWDSQQEEYSFSVKKQKTRNSWKSKSKKSNVEQPTVLQDKQEEEISTDEVISNGIGQQEFDFEASGIARDENNGMFNLLVFLDKHDLTYIDKRNKEGALWVIGNRSIDWIMKELASNGFKFTYLESGSRASKNKPAWFTK